MSVATRELQVLSLLGENVLTRRDLENRGADLRVLENLQHGGLVEKGRVQGRVAYKLSFYGKQRLARG